MEEIKVTFKKMLEMNIIQSILVVVISLFIYRIIVHLIVKGEENSKVSNKLNNRSKTYIRLMKSVIRYVFIIVTVLVLLQINGINVSSMLAGVGIVSVILGLAVQDALKDMIRGFNILSDSYFKVGDVVQFNDIIGKVEVLGLKTTKIKDTVTNDIISIANRNIEEIKLLSEFIFVEAPYPYELELSRTEEISRKIAKRIEEYEYVKKAEYVGVIELADSSVRHHFKIACNPEFRTATKRFANGCILKVFEEEGIAVPFNQLDVHQK